MKVDLTPVNGGYLVACECGFERLHLRYRTADRNKRDHAEMHEGKGA